MSSFAGDLFVKILPPDELMSDGKQLYKLEADLVYDSDILGNIVAPKGMLTDFASIPRIVWRYIDPEDPIILYPSVIHDALYIRRGTLANGNGFTREQADQVLREAMLLCGARWDQRATVYRAVRMFGGARWEN